MKKLNVRTSEPIRITFCSMNNKVPKIQEIVEFHPEWIQRGKFDKNTQENFDRLIKCILKGGYIAIGKGEHGKQHENRKRKKVSSK